MATERTRCMLREVVALAWAPSLFGRGSRGENEGPEGPCCCIWGKRGHEEAGREG